MIPLLMLLALTEPAPTDDPPKQTPAEAMAALDQIYQQSCVVREYATYDDLCDNLKRQIHVYQVELDRAAKAPPKPVPPAAPPKR